VVGQARVHEAHAGLVAFGMQRDLDGGRSGRDRVAGLFPAEGEDHLLHGNDLDVLPHRLELTGNEHPVDAAGPWVDLGDRAVPLDELVGFGEERPDRFWCRFDHDLAHELGHQRFSLSCWAASATSRSRSSPDVQYSPRNLRSFFISFRSARYKRRVPSRRSVTKPAVLRTARCCEIAERVTVAKRSAISVAGSSRVHTNRRISRRRGSANALSAASTPVSV